MKNMKGQGVQKKLIEIDGITHVYCNTNKASDISGYSRSYIRQMCKSEKLIATKKSGRWWIRLLDDANKIVYNLPT